MFLVFPRLLIPTRVTQAISTHVAHILSRDNLSVVEGRIEDVGDEYEVGAGGGGGG